MSPTHQRGFTLIEMMAVMVLVVAVTGVALNGYIGLSSQSLAAADLTRGARRATAVLDRVARDLEAARLVVKPAEMDPLEHPWVFLAEARGGSDGADRLKFVALGQMPIASSVAASDLAQVAWLTQTTADGTRELLRWSHPRLPEGLDRRFPRADDPGVFLVADGVEEFGVRFLDAEGRWTSRWDSSALVQSSQLPLVAEISVTMAPENSGDEPAGPFTRRVVLPMLPIDLAGRLGGEEAAAGSEDDEGEDENCLRVRDCIDAAALALEPLLANIVNDPSIQDQCLADTGIPASVLVEACQ
ncbi:MAG: prepilin-type N-terminal cleavage/methylation domain-containing protein [Deltaproteobacteria bacterium]|nr:prepilin-type N-terminal cleavage/methylation domain-containing protein [Deltaproteobacteria bacterium]MBW2447730.1 prepilin-type N-terminal cleavage/methylation domain-containing protein [Deltaproteobacteria bacterium]